MNDKVIYSISELNHIIKTIIDSEISIKNIVITGELQNFKKSQNGHYFFRLIDKDSQINCVIYSYFDFYNYEFSFKDGDSIEAQGSLIFFNKRGEIVFSINRMTLCGDGEKLLRKKLLIQKLFNEGLFDQNKKLNIPKYPRNIGIITSKTGAAIKDIEKNINSRYKISQLYLFPTLVQGIEAKSSIINAIKKTKEYDLDLLIIGRGGGSKEDLSVFDEEEVVRTVYSLNTPVISAIGHEIDKSIVDLVADLSVSTPTAAAISAVPDENDLLEFLDISYNQLRSALNSKLSVYKKEIDSIESTRFFDGINNIIESINNKIENCEYLLLNNYKNTINLLKNTIISKEGLIESLNPQNTLNRGYSIITDTNGSIIKSISVLNSVEQINIHVSDGKTNFRRKL